MVGFQFSRNDDHQAVFAEGTITGIRGERGAGFHHLILGMQLHVNPVPEASPERPRLTGLIADVHAGNSNLGRFVGLPWRLGSIWAPSRQARSQMACLECDLGRSRLEAVEALRAGGNQHDQKEQGYTWGRENE
jgi:hypothetical protein